LQPDSLESDHCAELLRALADPVRLRIIDVLRSAPKCVSELSEALDLEVVTVSHHLGILHSIGLLEREKKGRFKVYRLRRGVLAPAKAGDGKQHIDLGCCRLEIPPASTGGENRSANRGELVQLKGRAADRRDSFGSANSRVSPK
jgi:DNA-binding transcriptional ArsR family regulator